jgi:hypothetical protein
MNINPINVKLKFMENIEKDKDNNNNINNLESNKQIIQIKSRNFSDLNIKDSKNEKFDYKKNLFLKEKEKDGNNNDYNNNNNNNNIRNDTYSPFSNIKLQSNFRLQTSKNGFTSLSKVSFFGKFPLKTSHKNSNFKQIKTFPNIKMENIINNNNNNKNNSEKFEIYNFTKAISENNYKNNYNNNNNKSNLKKVIKNINIVNLDSKKIPIKNDNLHMLFNTY